MYFEFGYNEEKTREYLPTHGGIDWHSVYLDKHDNDDNWSVWGETSDNLGEFCEQLNQSNCAVYINDTDKQFDCIVITDHRDNDADFWFSRHQIGDDEFEEIVDEIHNEVMMVFTKYPTEQCVEYVLGVMDNDVEDGIPDNWK